MFDLLREKFRMWMTSRSKEEKTVGEQSRVRLDMQIQETRAGAAAAVHQVRREKVQTDRMTTVARQALEELRSVGRQT